VEKHRFKIPHYRLKLVRDRTVSYPVCKAQSSHSAAAIFHALLDDSDRERMAVLYLSASCAPLGLETVAVGGVSGVAVTVRDVLKGAIVANASSFLICHNHPGGNPAPSAEDIEFTKHIVEGARAIGLPMVDHIITCANGQHRSFYDMGILPT
jgi:DNA repair protein RadC